jgi:hypothetical protein
MKAEVELILNLDLNLNRDLRPQLVQAAIQTQPATSASSSTGRFRRAR